METYLRAPDVRGAVSWSGERSRAKVRGILFSSSRPRKAFRGVHRPDTNPSDITAEYKIIELSIFAPFSFSSPSEKKLKSYRIICLYLSFFFRIDNFFLMEKFLSHSPIYFVICFDQSYSFHFSDYSDFNSRELYFIFLFLRLMYVSFFFVSRIFLIICNRNIIFILIPRGEQFILS